MSKETKRGEQREVKRGKDFMEVEHARREKEDTMGDFRKGQSTKFGY